MTAQRVLFVAVLVTLCSLAHAGSCRNCTNTYDCVYYLGEFCCNNECVSPPTLGESCPCQQCASGLACLNGVCAYNGLDCSCNSAADCILRGAQGLIPGCVDNKCKLTAPSNPPINYFTPGGPCDSSCATKYCNTNQVCDYIPIGDSCTTSYYCTPGSGCFAGTCQSFKSAGEECVEDGQCPSNYICRKTSPSSPTICAVKAEAGEYCSDRNSCHFMNCTANNVCTYPARGDPCFSGTCGPSDTCSYQNYTCIAKNSLPAGERCGSGVECQSSICEGSCLPISSIGGFCNISVQCPNGQCLNNKCYGISFSGEKCNSTFACYNTDRPCQNGMCPEFFSAIGENCTSEADCAIGRCSGGLCYAPTTCQVQNDCGQNMICDCGECRVPVPYPFALLESYNARKSAQLRSRSPERDCVNNMVLNSQCESVIAKHYCYSYCSVDSPTTMPPHKIDCATLKVIALNVTQQPCCSVTNRTQCVDNIVNCNMFNENNIRPLVTRPSVPTAPISTPTSPSTPSSTPQSTPSVSAPQSAPTASAPQATPMTVPQTPTAVPLAAPISSAPISATPLAAPTSPDTCNCAAPTSLCDQELRVCVGLRVTPIVQCVEYSNNQYTAYMAYLNDQPINVTLSNDVNFLNVNVQNKVTLFTTGRPFTYPQSAFNVITNSAQQVTWYLDGFKLNFDIAAADLRCPQDVTFQMTSSATVEQLIAISDSLIGNLSDVMQIARSRLNVTFSASAKRQSSSSVITVVVKADQSSADSSSQVVLDFVQTGFATFTSRVPTAAVASVTTVPPANEQSGSQAVTPPTNNPVALNAPRDRTVVSNSARVLVNITLLLVVSFLF